MPHPLRVHKRPGVDLIPGLAEEKGAGMHDGWTEVAIGVVGSVTLVVTYALHAMSGLAERTAKAVRALKAAKAEIQRPAKDGNHTGDDAQ
jgi:hypothetical protein